VAQSEGSCDGVTGLKIVIGGWKLELQITMADGRTHLYGFSDSLSLVRYVLPLLFD
jgi:hypothetical protein